MEHFPGNVQSSKTESGKKNLNRQITSNEIEAEKKTPKKQKMSQSI